MGMRAALLLLLLALGGCAGGRQAAVWDGRRGYDGNGDYGYDLAASRAEARGYRSLAAPAYAVPGTPDDPWGPYIREASGRFGLPERWIREVMRQESGGRLTGGDGLPITSPVGAMGLMQVMPRTYDILRSRYGLGPDPYEPRDNILAGAAYLREMHDRFGAPAFLAAYNAGPDRVTDFLAGSRILPDETMRYVANIAPRLGMPAYGGGAIAEADRAYAGGGLRGGDYGGGSQLALMPSDPADRAFEGGGLVTPDAPTGRLTGR
ncbi:lytic transglycosylase domain-containing protein [Belnapia moabensis]|uniref:lytic transglycosylase domain-containing protein n=1 Tax=Belnapia moabensis TaxID=365533 RepID=UPI000693D0B4